MVKFCRYFRHYLLGRKFLLRTDHSSLVWLLRFRHIEGQLARWLEELSQYDVQIEHRSGKKHSNADGLSRIAIENQCDCYQAGKELSSLPCGGCKYCTRIHSQWERFNEDVDDVIPLAVKSVSICKKENIEKENDTSKVKIETEGSLEEPGSWCSHYSNIKLKELQMQDQDLKHLIKWLTEKEPSQHELFLSSPALKSLWLCRSQLDIIDGVLYYIWASKPSDRKLLIVPSSMKSEVLEMCHDSKTAGHYAFDKTLQKLRQRFFWFNLTSDCKTYVSSCKVCSQNKKPSKSSRASLRTYHAGFPMERIHLDILGPFPPSEQGNVYILVMIDQFTKWVECAAIPNQSAELIAQKFLLHFIVTFGCPIEVHTDQRRNFDGSLFKSLCELLQIAKTRTTPYHPSSNGQVERVNRTLFQMIRCYIEGKAQYWDRDLPLLVMAMHATENRTTGFTPNMLMLGREVNLPVDILTGSARVNSEKLEPAEWLTKLQEIMTEAHTLARENISSSQRRQKRLYDLRSNENIFDEGDVVYKLDQSTKIGRSRKLQSPCIGPYLIIGCRHPIYDIRNRKREMTIHHDKLKVCKDRTLPLWLRRMRHQYLHKTRNDVSLESLPEEGEDEEEDTKQTSANCEILDRNVNDQKKDNEQNKNNKRKQDKIETVTRTGRQIRKPKHLENFLS